jgi:hypothetical protein
MNEHRLTRRRPGLTRLVRALPVIACFAAAASLLAASSVADAASAACPTINRPNILKVSAGSPQTAQLRKPFQTNLQVTLANSNGCPLTGSLGGLWIDFTAPDDGASGTFASTGTNHVTVGTDATGVAAAPEFTANEIAGSYSIQVDSDFGSLRLYLTNTASGVAATINATAPTDQSAPVNAHYARPLQVQLLDADGRPVQGTEVTFNLTTGATGASAAFVGGTGQVTATTNAEGQATSPPFVANGTPGRFAASASTAEIAAVASFRLANRAARNRLTASRPAGQTAAVETRFRQPLSARLSDASGTPIEGATVTFTLPTATTGAGATFVGGSNQATALTDTSGEATSPPLVANTKSGSYTATASVSGVAKSINYPLRNLAASPATIAAGSASGQSTPAGTRFAIPLAVTVTDENDNPVAGEQVTFTAPGRGPSGRFGIGSTSRLASADAKQMTGQARGRRIVRVKTDRNGVAIAPAFTANRRPGGYVVTAAVGGRRTAFALVNLARNT